MKESIEIARGVIAPDSVLTIQLIRYPGRADLLVFRWPAKPTELQPAQLPAVTNVIIAALA